MSFPRYAAYKDSGVGWLGDVPAHWGVVRLKFVAQVQTGIAKGKDNTNKATVEVPYLRVANVQDGYLDLNDIATIEIPQDDLARYRLQPGDVLMNEGGDFDKLGRGHVWDGSIDPCIHQNHVFAVRPFGLSPEWLNLFTGSIQAQFFFMSRSKQSTNLASISSTNVMELPVVVPPPEERTTIALFLSRETAKIDALVEEQRRLIELLKEKRQAVISQAVTKGLNPNVPMKDSGVAWLGRVPAHWRTTRVKRVARDGRRTFVDGDWIELPFITADGVRLLQCGNVGTGVFEEQGYRYISEETFKELDCTEVEPNDVLICRLQSSRTILAGRACLAPDLGTKMVTSVDNCIVKPSAEFDPAYVVLQLSTPAYLSFIEVVARGGTRDRISRSQLASIEIAAPPLDEQRAIVEIVQRDAVQIDALVSEASLAMDLLQERRSALVSAAVTGKIDVRGLVPQAEAIAA